MEVDGKVKEESQGNNGKSEGIKGKVEVEKEEILE